MKTFMIHTSNIYFCQVVALQIMRANYEQLVKAHQRAPQVRRTWSLMKSNSRLVVGPFSIYISNM